jgi:hybrid polyketide synthase/nonribosomal peptide synthetase ACE1
MYIGESNLKMLSPNGRSRMWDADADGYARGEGVAAIVMKTLTNALADGDHIECIIRETGANQDGFSNGLTVPSSEAQAALIRRTYLKAGLDPATRPDDRPQYFEAHGTGTQAGDPKEAAAIHDVFGRHHDAKDGKADPLYVGSIKTVIGHLEGAAGLAGLLKASVSLQKGLIPPNRSFHRLNPKIEPFYHGLHVPTAVTAWPSIPDGVPRRASVNSFGFGGANAHAILEAYSPATQAISPSEDTQTKISFAPYVFSASTETSLVALLEKYSQGLRSRLDSGEQIDRSDLAWTLHSRRTRFPVRVSFPASSVQDLVTGIGSKIAAAKSNSGTPVGFRSSGKAPTPRILGIFTGQGAQWPAMGASLIRSSSLVSEIVDRLDDALSSLPLSDRPEWSLRTEMLAGVGTSRISEAALSQPLCTALQIILVDILREAGIKFSSVVGHSSGEIAAAYAAGFFSARDAMRIAYYRGLFAKLSGNEQNGQKGAMLAVGSSYEDARDFINSDVFKGRLAVAAHNSSASVTLSGDADAIIEAKAMLDKKKVFARLLKVDTAYHSHHMSPCSDVYIEALRACEIKVNHERDTTCSWFSSVIPGAKVMHSTDEVECIYWKDNMVNTVLFAEAVGKAIQNDEHINMVLEVGPHPALKGPATQSIGDLRPSPLPYSGLLSRGTDDVTALSDAFGFLWTMFAADSVNLASFDRALSGASQSRKLMVDLPVYQWDHGRVHWSESRKSKRIRERTDAPHELLGVSSPESNSHDMRWTNILKADEIGWMEGHKLQGLIVFPAAGYVAMALEACRKLTGVDAVQLIEMNDLSIPKAVTFPEGDTSGVETLVTLTKIEHHSDETITADFSLYAGPNVSTGSNHNLELTASASMKVILGNPDFEALPYSVAADESNMSEVDPDRIYAAFSKLGYGYSAAFKGLSSTKRKLNKASALVDTYKYAEDDSTFYMVHPSMLDVAIQSAMLAYASPGDGRLWSLHVPTGIRSIRVNPSVCSSLSISGGRVPIVTSLGESSEFSASIDILSEDGRHGMIQVEDMVLKPFAPATEADDRWMFTATTLGNATPDALSLTELPDTQSASRRAELDAVCERISRYFLRKWRSEITDDDWEKTPEPHNRQFRDFIDSAVSGSTRAYSEDAWINDTDRDIELLVSKYSSERSVKLFSAVAQMLPEIVRGHSTIRDPMGVDGLLDHFCSRDLEYTSSQLLLAGMVKQITFRYPHARILEIGNNHTLTSR